MQAFFPDRYIAIALPALLLVVAITLVLTFVGIVMMKSGKKKKPAADKKDA